MRKTIPNADSDSKLAEGPWMVAEQVIFVDSRTELC